MKIHSTSNIAWDISDVTNLELVAMRVSCIRAAKWVRHTCTPDFANAEIDELKSIYFNLGGNEELWTNGTKLS